MNNKNSINCIINRKREQSDHEQWVDFEHTLRYILFDLHNNTDRDDSFLLDDIKQAIIVFAMKDKFEETNENLLENMKNDFYESITKLEERHPDIKCRTTTIRMFMEKFYFNK